METDAQPLFVAEIAYFGNALDFAASRNVTATLTSVSLSPEERGKMAQERRHFQRIALDSPVRVLLDESENGFLLDVCEGGLAVCELGPRTPGQVVPFAFDLPESSGRIQGRAEIVWKSASGRRTGLHFVEIDDPCRQRLVQWISTQAWTLKLDGVEKEPREPAHVARPADVPATASPVPSATDDAERTWMLAPAGGHPAPGGESTKPMPENAHELWSMVGRDVKSTPAVSAVLTGLVLAVIIGLLLYHFHGTRISIEAVTAPAAQLPAAIPAAATGSTPVSLAPTVPAVPATSAEPPISATSKDNAGFILQVGALTVEANAAALLKDLKQKNLPAFIFHREGDNFYRVAVGPFTDSESSIRVKGELEKQGLKPFLRKWEPKVESARN